MKGKQSSEAQGKVRKFSQKLPYVTATHLYTRAVMKKTFRTRVTKAGFPAMPFATFLG
jgi:hypothetical protein